MSAAAVRSHTNLTWVILCTFQRVCWTNRRWTDSCVCLDMSIVLSAALSTALQLWHRGNSYLLANQCEFLLIPVILRRNSRATGGPASEPLAE